MLSKRSESNEVKLVVIFSYTCARFIQTFHMLAHFVCSTLSENPKKGFYVGTKFYKLKFRFS